MSMSQQQRSNLSVDAVVFGTGIMGLMLAKRLLDVGQRVVIIEKSSTLANGASVQNHGWVHYGTTHSISADSIEQGSDTARRMQFGYDFFKAYAPECFDEPFEKTYVIAKDAARARLARERWTACGVPHRELTRVQFKRIEPNLKPAAANYFFEVADGRINTRMLYRKLYTEIVRRGAVVLTSADYTYCGERHIVVTTPVTTTHVRAKVFLYATGTGTGTAYEKLTGTQLPLRFFKSHMIFAPKLTNVSIISLDRDNPIVMNHGNVSAFDRTYDETPTTAGDGTVVAEEVSRALAAMARLYKTADGLRPEAVTVVAAIKPSLSFDETAERHHVEPVVHEPVPGHIFVLPGKMTAAPFVAAEIMKHVAAELDMAIITPRPFDVLISPTLPAESVLWPHFTTLHLSVWTRRAAARTRNYRSDTLIKAKTLLKTTKK